MKMKYHLALKLRSFLIVLTLVSPYGWRSTVSLSMPIHHETLITDSNLPLVVRQYPLISKVSWWPYGTCYDVAYDPQTGLILIGSGEVLKLLDVSDPSQPFEVNEIILQGQHQHIALSDGIAYVTTYRRDGLQIIDVSNPASLQTIAFYPAEGNPHGIEIQGSTAFLAVGQNLDILDISNPDSPRLRSQFPVTGRVAHSYISNQKLYLTVWSEGVYVLDVSDPNSPVQLGFYASPTVSLFAVTGNIALLAKWYDHTVQIFDVSDDSTFHQISTLDLLDETNNPYGVVVDIEFSGSLAFISGEYWDHLQAVDLSTPYSPAVIGSINARDSSLNPLHYYSGGGSITLVDDLIFQASWTDGVGIFNVSNPVSIQVVGNFDTPDPYHDVSVSGHIACIANSSDGLRLLDISNPMNIREIGARYTRGTFLQVICTDDQYAYAATEGWGLQIFTIGQPDSPQLIGSIDTSGIAQRLAVSNGFAYVADGEGGLRVIDVRAPSTPVEAGFSTFSASATRVVVSDTYAYVGAEDGTIHILDVSNPTHPNIVGVFPLPGTPSPISSLAVFNRELYVGIGASVYRLDISKLDAPQLISSIIIPSGESLEDIALIEGRAYVSSMPFGLWVIDTTDPVSMDEIGSYQVPGPGRGVDVVGGLIFYACDDAGLLILKDNSR